MSGAKWGAAPWYGVDFDGTLVKSGQPSPGAWTPIAPMVERVRAWLAAGEDVHVVTARAHTSFPDSAMWTEDVRRFCAMFFGRELRVRCDKDGGMVELWDDRARQVVTDTGAIIYAQLYAAQRALHEIVEHDRHMWTRSVNERVEAEARGEIVNIARRALGLPTE